MRLNYLKAILRTAVHGATVLLLGAGVAGAQQVVNLTARPATATLPDGSAVPMWGYSCGAVVSGSTATCAALNPSLNPRTAANSSIWSPVVITVPVGATGGLQIHLTKNLSFQPPTPSGGTAPPANDIPPSLTIVGQFGGGLGSPAQQTTAA